MVQSLGIQSMVQKQVAKSKFMDWYARQTETGTDIKQFNMEIKVFVIT